MTLFLFCFFSIFQAYLFIVISFRYSYFAFEHSPSYQEVQFLFLDAVESLHPDNISVSEFVLSINNNSKVSTEPKENDNVLV